MPTLNDVRKICAKLPGAVEGSDHGFGFGVENKGKMKGIVWSWKERVDPKKPRVENLKVLAVMVPNLAAKDLIMRSGGDKFVVDPHYNGFPAVLVRLEKVTTSELEDMIVEAWKSKAPKAIVKEFEAQ